jgi:uncharacterized Fe-S cluster-containing radical SAM superfamily protein
MRYRVEDGRVLTRALEIHVVDHCNLRCRECCTLSPFLPERFADPDEVRRDLDLARRVIRPEYVKLTGGEPLLHPRIVELLRIARESGIAKIVSVTTNGVLLPRMPEEFWRLADEVTLSVYPGIRVSVDRPVRVKRQDEFQRMTRSEPHKAAETYETCWMKRRCHMIRAGRFYMCTRPPHLQTVFGGTFGEADGVSLHDGPGMLDELVWYLERNEPLASCRLCWGTRGAKFPHEQMKEAECSR